MSRLLVSVRSVAEAEAALTGGAEVIDVKEPARGPLGRAPAETIAAVIRSIAGRRPVSAALGELCEEAEPPPAGLVFWKWGLAGCGDRTEWRRELVAAAERGRTTASAGRLVAVAYADWQRARSPEPAAVAAFAGEHGCGALLLDTWGKDGMTLLDWLSLTEICGLCRGAGVPVALAGSLGLDQIRRLLPARPAWFAVRGAVCRGGRLGPIDATRVAELAGLLRASDARA